MTISALQAACLLSPAEYYKRLGEFQHLFAVALSSYERARGRLTLTLEGPLLLETQALDLLRREQECCPFFAFAITPESGSLTIEAKVPDEVDECLDDLERLARLVIAGRADA